MHDTRGALPPDPGQARHDEVESLAAQVLSALAQRSGQSGHAIDEAMLNRFCSDILKGDKSLRTDAVAELQRKGVGVSAILDGYIPAAARELGERWCRDELSFADVTIGSARLQAIMRELSAPWVTDAMTPADAPNVMLIVPLEEFHTLGGMTATSQLRRMGISVCLCLGQTEDEILEKVAARRFDMIAISVSCRHKLDSARRLVGQIRAACGEGVPIVIGGRVVEGTEDVCALTGADHATVDPREALKLCGVRAPVPAPNDRLARI
ncbi:cobalamin B12-binding domain-containing protein [Rhodovulum euryhalinum]|uniref:Methylmalonyl-CoA mutase cobalamin-binding subunit n=1 Tax=Rhodovulum euryhalinum TaxID=35805 RepID=A0A4R2KJT1_9RHOB|nr:cobalamin B12-binding domain-containing protein [Rhodovulum euryhalinum]TCO73554.1 methylmalonyl-CoA mutase cobalamin-binding subunit [Rhodovulum euryhalinum]